MKITIIGCGTMGSAFAQRLASSNTVLLYDRHTEKTERLQKFGHGIICQNLEEAIQQSDAIILAIKPQSVHEIATLMCCKPPANQMLISLLAGIPLARLKGFFPHHRLVRMMPNLPIIYGEGLIGLVMDDPTESETAHIFKLCASLGKVYRVNEKKINAFTAIAGSGPAFILTIIEAIIEAGINMGFNAQESQELVCQMMKGSLHLLNEDSAHPAALKWQIASPGGTTIAGLKTLEEWSVRGGVINTFLAAYEKANELAS